MNAKVVATNTGTGLRLIVLMACCQQFRQYDRRINSHFWYTDVD